MGTEKEDKVYAVFQTISKQYDRMNDVISLGLHRKWKRALVAEVSAGRPQRVLDVCCGTGDLSLALARAMPEAEVCGLDFSEEMLKVAAARLAGEGLANLKLRCGNAMALPFEDGYFDCVVISFGLRNLPDFQGAVRELARVTRPGGGVYCLDSSYPEAALVRPFYKLYMKHFVSLLGGLLAHNRAEYRWLYDSTEQFLPKGDLLRLFAVSGLTGCTCKPYLFGAAARHSGVKAT